MKYLSVCSGIEAASVAWEPLGFKPVGFSEIEPVPCSILAHRFPHVPNFGDMNNFEDWPLDPHSFDILVGGTPCQSFSLAGLRGGLEDGRGNLALTYCRILQRFKPEWFLWENVPGVLSSNKGRDFGSILGAMVKLGYGVAYCIRNASYFGVPQRRRRVFVVGCLGDWRRATEVLFEPGCVQGDSPKSSKKRKDITGTLASRSSAGRGLGTDFDLDGGLVVSSTGSKSHCLNAGGMGRQDYETETMIVDRIAKPLMKEGNDSHDPELQTYVVCFAQNSRNEVRLEGGDGQRTGSITSGGGKPGQGYPAIAGSMGVRRLTPVETERLQGFPDNWTLVPHRGKPTADGPRYKAIGNSKAIPVVRWIGKRIQAQHILG